MAREAVCLKHREDVLLKANRGIRITDPVTYRDRINGG